MTDDPTPKPDGMPSPEDPTVIAQIREVMERTQRIAPVLVRYAWLGEGIHQPLPEHAVMGLLRVQVTWLKTTGEIPEPGWLTDAEQFRAIGDALGASEAIKEAVARDARPYTTLMVRYWTSGVANARYVLYKMLVGGAGSDHGNFP